ncbi:hypothetical protein COMA2_20427 [Candidatus Nitrospira nitrificans]|uniref:Uncharacterized protein n=1 Tax=Candidatus Nitrospira nitrificans TaxID=1742973 RepID=A0A0S4LIK3_9BACT|nr:hypothetical protein COMA2_20427 [Candidatus Nitrospira nitrificans]
MSLILSRPLWKEDLPELLDVSGRIGWFGQEHCHGTP